jgi:drug/metabolite transporter (DMT)-like permease
MKRWFGIVDLVLLLTVLIWAANFSVAKAVLSHIPPLAFNTIRLVGASAILLGLTLFDRPRTMTRSDLPRMLLLALVGHTFYQFSFVFGLDRTTASNSALLIAMTPVVVALLGQATGEEKPSFLTWLGVAASVFGAYLVIDGSSTTGGSTFGDLLILTASVCWAIYTVGSKSLLPRIGALRLSAYTMTAGSLFFIPFGIPSLFRISYQEVPWSAWVGTVYSFVFALSAAYFFWYYAVSRIGATRTAIYSNLTPVAGLVIAWLTLGERVSWRQIVGAGVILGSIYLVRRSRITGNGV